MAVRMEPSLAGLGDDLRIHPTAKRIRVSLGSRLICDTTSAFLVWEPRRIVPTYAVPAADLAAELEPAESKPLPDPMPPFLGPYNFAAHSCPGRAFSVRADGEVAAAAAFVPDDPDLADHVVLDFGTTTPFTWMEEDEPAIGHPHDPFKRIDVLRSDRRIVVSHRGEVLADSRRAMALFETSLPTRWYLPADDVRLDLLTPSVTRTVCAYKGTASYYSLASGAARDIAWFYPDPLHDAARVRDHVCFYAEKTDLAVDGVDQERPVTPWSDPKDRARSGRS
jgi:uncharacterized protein (DUF427 family)